MRCCIPSRTWKGTAQVSLYAGRIPEDLAAEIAAYAGLADVDDIEIIITFEYAGAYSPARFGRDVDDSYPEEETEERFFISAEIEGRAIPPAIHKRLEALIEQAIEEAELPEPAI
jgi:hypothetical protein